MELFHELKDEYGISLDDYHKAEYSSKNTLFVHPPLHYFEDIVSFPVKPNDARYCYYENGDLFMHKDKRVRSRVSLLVDGTGGVKFFDDDKKFIAEATGECWTLINTDKFHKVEMSSYRLSFQFGFDQTYNELIEIFKNEQLIQI